LDPRGWLSMDPRGLIQEKNINKISGRGDRI
jgi:hypothetical protein